MHSVPTSTRSASPNSHTAPSKCPAGVLTRGVTDRVSIVCYNAIIALFEEHDDDLSHCERTLLLVLPTWLTNSGICWVVIPTLMRITGYSKRRIRESLRSLHEKEILQVVPGAGPQGSSMIRLCCVNPKPLLEGQNTTPALSQIAPKELQIKIPLVPVPGSIPEKRDRDLKNSNTEKPPAPSENGNAFTIGKKILDEHRERTVKTRAHEQTFNTWFRPIRAERWRDRMLWLSVPNETFRARLLPETQALLESARAVLPQLQGIKWVLRGECYV